MDSPALTRIRGDLAAGRLWKARDRVTGLFAARPADEDVLALAGEVYFAMGDLPRAGAFWYLTGRAGPDVDTAMAALHERYPRPTDLVAGLPVRDQIASFPEPARARLSDLQRALHEHGHDWDPPGKCGRRVEGKGEGGFGSAIARIAAFALGAVLILLTAGVWLVGVAYLVDRLRSG